MKIMILGKDTPFGASLDAYLMKFNTGNNIMAYTSDYVWGLDNVGILNLIVNEQPDRVITCCESIDLLEEYVSMYRKNVVIPHLVAHACHMINVGGHFVFSRANLCDMRVRDYSRSKAQLEEVIKTNYPKTTIIRLGSEIGHFNDYVIRTLVGMKESKQANIACADKAISFTYIDKAVFYFVRNFINGYTPYGQYNLYSNGVSFLDIISKINTELNLGFIINAESRNVKPEFSNELLFSCLGDSDTKLNYYKISVEPWEFSMVDYLSDYVDFVRKGLADAGVG